MADDEREIGMVLEAMYRLVSGPAGPRDWSGAGAVFHPECRMIRTGRDHDDRPSVRIMTLDEYASANAKFFDEQGFYETEVGRRIHLFGAIAHAWSAYEIRLAPKGPAERRGINSVQLCKDGQGRWRILSMFWDNEGDGRPLPSL
ncbi:MAG TPA: hypothetical protein VD929_04040 [Caulobacteraceae bacterium]|nr:hypothetical protein [Caulobacteraceae bacterium]